jgi:hypothetical protein
MESFTLELTPAQLKITHAALRSMLDDFGHEERDVTRLLQGVLAKFPDAETVRAIDLSEELRRRPAAA